MGFRIVPIHVDRNLSRKEYARVLWRQEPFAIGDAAFVTELEHASQNNCHSCPWARMGPEITYVLVDGQLQYTKPPSKDPSGRRLNPGERWVDVPMLRDVIRACGDGRYFLMTQDVNLWEQKSLELAGNHPAGSLFKLVDGTFLSTGHSVFLHAEFLQVHWEGWKRAGKSISLGTERHKLPVGDQFLQEYTAKVGAKVIRTVSATCAPRPAKKTIGVLGAMASETLQAQSSREDERGTQVEEKDTVTREERIASSSTTASTADLQDATEPGRDATRRDGSSGEVFTTAASSNTGRAAGGSTSRTADVEVDVGVDPDDASPKVVPPSRGICVACLEMEAQFVGRSCGHLVFCEQCLLDAATMLHKGAVGRTKGADKIRKRMLHTTLPCPMCRAEATLTPVCRFKGVLRVVEPYLPG